MKALLSMKRPNPAYQTRKRKRDCQHTILNNNGPGTIPMHKKWTRTVGYVRWFPQLATAQHPLVLALQIWQPWLKPEWRKSDLSKLKQWDLEGKPGDRNGRSLFGTKALEIQYLMQEDRDFSPGVPPFFFFSQCSRKSKVMVVLLAVVVHNLILPNTTHTQIPTSLPPLFIHRTKNITNA